MSDAAASRAPGSGLRAPGQLPLTVEIVDGRDGFARLEREWNEALARGPRDEPMLRHEWLRAWIENFAPGTKLRTFVARSGREICTAVPLIESLERSADTCFVPMITWSAPVNDQSQRGGLLLGRRWEEGLELIWRALRTQPWDRLRLRELPETGPEWRLRTLAEEDGFRTGLWVSLRSPYLTLPKTYPEIEARLDGKFRQNLRRRRRRLAERGEVRYEIVDGKDPRQLDEALADFLEIEAGGWKGRGGTAIAQKPELVGFYAQIARDAAKRGALSLGLLRLAGKPIAAHLSVVHGGRHFLVKLGYDESLREYSPGQQLVAEAIRDACARGLREFDFLGPCMDWKLDWEPLLRAHAWLTIFRPTPAGKLVAGARFTLWPVLRKLFREES